jgi:hypothetical protein
MKIIGDDFKISVIVNKKCLTDNANPDIKFSGHFTLISALVFVDFSVSTSFPSFESNEIL